MSKGLTKPGSLIAVAGVELSKTGLRFPDGVTREMWLEVAQRLDAVLEVTQWAVGDLAVALNPEWGDKYTEVMEQFDVKYGSAAIAKHVAVKFPFLRRRKNLPFSWHQEVAPLPVKEQEELLDWAETKGEDGKRPTHRQLRERVRERRKAIKLAATPALPDGVYRVIYADPPWEYGDKRTNDANSGSAESQYPTMAVDELCGLGVRDIAATDSVLFLWATAPCLPEAMQVIEAWGFTYKAQFVWDKLKGFNGHYNDVRHELLLIATRGSCVPAVDSLDPSVVPEKRTKHSKKPERFYELIERLYPLGDRTHVELFSRRSRDGWCSWGNQVDAATR